MELQSSVDKKNRPLQKVENSSNNFEINGKVIRDAVLQHCIEIAIHIQADERRDIFKDKKVHLVLVADSNESETPDKSAKSVSLNEKEKVFNALGIEVVPIHLESNTTPEEFEKVLLAGNNDEQSLGTIVQLPIAGTHRAELDQLRLTKISPGKDLDCITGHEDRVFDLPATADAVIRVVKPFVEPGTNERVTIIGAKGFIGRNVARGMQNFDNNIKVIKLDMWHTDPMKAAEERNKKEEQAPQNTEKMQRIEESNKKRVSSLMQNDSVVALVSSASTPKMVDEKFFETYGMPKDKFKILVDVGFMPPEQASKENKPRGSVDKNVYPELNWYTPVPGGMGPIEMAVLAERVTMLASGNKDKMWEMTNTGEVKFINKKGE